MNKLIKYLLFVNLFLFGSCIQKQEDTVSSQTNWQTELKEKLPLLGHRNWIVVTDMAYPLQAKKGITTLYAQESYVDVLSAVKKMVDNSPHVYAHIYQDEELSFLDENFCSGINQLKKQINEVLLSSKIQSIKHDHLIARLDSISNLFEIIVIKTELTMPYTSTFFELDCKYWDSNKQTILEKKMASLDIE
ncbi:MAG: hypothetical protein J6K31_09330 [Parabacteroides sp.]|nr:hypothetical protein [Parabacteroides sp.]